METSSIKTKVCTSCKKSKDASLFYRRGLKGLRATCKECSSKKSKQWRDSNLKQHRSNYVKWAKKNPTKTIERHLKQRYGISIEDYEGMLEKQEGCCAICGVHTSGEEKNLAVDHCHNTGKVRGLLCFDCNTGLGKLKDSEELLRKALKYLEVNNE